MLSLTKHVLSVQGFRMRNPPLPYLKRSDQR